MLLESLVADGMTPVGAYAALRQRSGTGCFLLESVVAGERWGRYSILGCRPRLDRVLYGSPGVNPFAALAAGGALNQPASACVAERFFHAQVGVVAYDAVHFCAPISPWPSYREPVARFVAEATIVVFDNLAHTATVAAPSRSELEATLDALRRGGPLPLLPVPERHRRPADLTVDMDDASFGRAVERIQGHIRAGDAFQVVPSRTFSTPTRGANILDVYRALRVLSPAPYMYLLELPETSEAPALSVAGASPETLVRVDAGLVTTRPAAGTRRRGKTPEEDEALARELRADAKEVAEHVMLIDLGRNDVGRIAVSGTVEVPVRLAVERFSHVMHLVSEVRGRVRPGLTPWEVLEACFPAGTLSGAPKVRAMQIIRDVDATPRGVYGGAVGYVTPSGDLDFAIAIRTVVERQGRFEVRAGAGIVADSCPEAECEETRNKAASGLAAIAAAQAVLNAETP